MVHLGGCRQHAWRQRLSFGARPQQESPRKIIGVEHRGRPQEQQRPTNVKARVECSGEVRAFISILRRLVSFGAQMMPYGWREAFPDDGLLLLV